MPATAQLNTGIMAGWALGEDGWDVDMNANLRKLDALIQARVVDKDLSAPPTPPVGSCYIVGAAPTGAWATHATKIARYGGANGTTWEFYTPRPGWEVYVIDENVKYRFNSAGTAWVALP